MGVVKELIVAFSAESIQDISREGAIKAFEKIGLDKCFTVEFQNEAELKRDALSRTLEFNQIDDPDDAELPPQHIEGAFLN
jgi:hypothetical protein